MGGGTGGSPRSCLSLSRPRTAPIPPEQAFADYVRVLTDWRGLPYLDPGLPAELLPGGWIGIRAAEEFFTWRTLLEEPARAYVQRIIGG